MKLLVRIDSNRTLLHKKPLGQKANQGMSAAAFRLGQTIEAAELTAVGSSKTAGTFSNDGHYNA